MSLLVATTQPTRRMFFEITYDTEAGNGILRLFPGWDIRDMRAAAAQAERDGYQMVPVDEYWRIKAGVQSLRLVPIPSPQA